MTNPPSPYGTQQSEVPDTQTVRRPAASAPRRIMGIQPVLFVGMCLLAIVTLITVVLIFVGDFESQAARVVWTVVVFLAFTGLLALDLVLARRSATPLVIGVAANTYLLAVLMIAIWVRGGDTGEMVDEYDFGSGWFFAELLGIVLLTLLVVRAAAAGAWGLISLGHRSGTQFGRVLGQIAAALLGLAGVLLTLHFAIEAFGIELGEWYWRATVAAIVVTALAASVTVLLFWNRRNLDWQEAEARGEHVRPRVAPGTVLPGGAQQGWPQQQAWPQQPAPQQPQQPPQQQPDANGLLPWPTFPDGSPYPMGPDGQPVFPPSAR
ncbi:hypothetical protein [Agrococcus sp. Marseille-P2731]|uniref:hypothetical protein n=1 Tax=Agrococcus sp. Marseille-P2731 TaxID=1841862 RepID=UPI000930D96A|nr:hypothetical protein [Agrococcus sp. Marseille-P2731]